MVYEIERYVELVDTFDLPIEAEATYDKWRAALAEELGYEPSEALTQRTWEATPILRESLPEVGIAFRRVEMKWGWQSQYTSVDPGITGQRAGTVMSFKTVAELTGLKFGGR